MIDIQARIDRVIELPNCPWAAIREDVVSIIKELKFELDEAQMDAEIWKNTDITSQAEIKKLQAEVNFWKGESHKEGLLSAEAKDLLENQVAYTKMQFEEIARKDAVIAELREYKSMYEGLCK